MDDLTLNLIYALKYRKYDKKSLIEEAIAFLSEYTCTPAWHYNEMEMKKISQMCFVDFLRTARNPAYEVERLFDVMNRNENITLSLLESLRATQVRDKNGYINGFRDPEENASS